MLCLSSCLIHQKISIYSSFSVLTGTEHSMIERWGRQDDKLKKASYVQMWRKREDYFPKYFEDCLKYVIFYFTFKMNYHHINCYINIISLHLLHSIFNFFIFRLKHALKKVIHPFNLNLRCWSTTDCSLYGSIQDI